MALVIGTNVPETLDDADGVTEASDDIFGHGGGDVIFGLGGADDIFGGSGDDYIMGGGGADDIDGEGGDDDADYGDSNAAVQVSLLTGAGTGGTAQGDELESIENLFGSPHDDLLVGDDNVNVLMGLVGDDTLNGGGGDDELRGNSGDDSLNGGSGDDTIWGSVGTDDIDGEGGIDTVSYNFDNVAVQVSLLTGDGTGGTAQGDELESIENLTGSFNGDLLVGDDNVNVLDGAQGDDTLKGGGGDDTLKGGGGDDNLKGGGGDDTLNGGSDNDTLKGGGGEDTLHGSSGIDTAAYNQSADGVNVFLILNTASGGDAEGDELNSIENLIGSNDADQLWGNNIVNLIKGENGHDTLKGFGGADTILGGNQNDTILGMDGVDTISGENGNDILDGGAGNDTMDGGLGNDTFIVDSAGDTVIEGSFDGNDTVKASANYDLAADVWVETLRTTNDAGLSAINLDGNGAQNTIIGNAGANILDGEGGADTMSGLAGNDIYYVNNLGDTIVEAADSGSDIVRATQTYILAAGVSVEGLTTTDPAGLNSMTLVGNDNAQTIQGNAAINVLRGFAGNDNLQGMGGNDTLTGHAGADKFLFNTALNAATNVDTITDMTAGADLIRLDDAFFAGIGAVGVLNADAFHIGAAAADAEDRIIYNSATGQLFHDSNGTGAGGSTLFANLATGLALSNTDFNVV